MKKLWVDKHSPSTLDGYVFRDEDQKRQVQSWIQDGSIPHLLFSGPPGTGKCLGPDERINVEIDESQLTPDQLKTLHTVLQSRGAGVTDPEPIRDRDANCLTAHPLTMQELFQIFNCEDLEHEQHRSVPEAVRVETPTGYQPIRALVAKIAPTSRYFFRDHTSVVCADRHLFLDADGQAQYARGASEVLTSSGTLEITGRESLGDTRLYDITIDDPHIYITADGKLHHNTTLAKALLNELKVDWGDVLIINASVTNGVDEVRNRILNFSSSMPFGDSKYVLLDECLDQDTPVWVLRNGQEISVPIKDVDPVNDLVKTHNVEQARMEWKSFQLFDKGTQETLEIEFEDGSLVICTPDHKWYVEDEHGNVQVVKAKDLSEIGHVLTT